MQALGRYELLRPLARGGMAEVYLARRRVAGVEKRLVIKRMRREHSRDPRFLDLFVREAQLSMSLVQQNIVPVFDFGRIGDDVFLAMEHIDGRDLGSTLGRDRTAGAPPIVAAFIAAECCAALDHAHRRRDAAAPGGVIHRDVTPRNVLLAWAGEVKLADFGIAAVAGQVSGQAIGTAAYMSPEQARGEGVDARGDLYALGMVLWESLVGDHVRPTETRAATLAAAKDGALPPIDPAIPAPLAAIIARATARDPAERFATARQMADALDAYIVAERARDAGPPPAARLGDWLRARWGDEREREDAATSDTPVTPAGPVVTFLDDGEDQIRTQRSMAETVDDSPPPPTPTAKVEPVPVAAPPPRRGRLIAVAGGLAVVAIAVVLWQRPGEAPRPPEPPVPAPGPAPVPAPAPPPVVVERAPDPVVEPTPPQPVPAPTKPPPRKALVTKPATRPPSLPEARAKRSMTIGAIPWANVTIDGDPTPHETPVTLELAVGPHRVTFRNPSLGVDRTVTVTVPAEGPARHVEKLER